MANTCVTWLGLKKGDAQREATRLAKLYPAYCDLVPIDRVSAARSSFFPIIVVGHDGDVLNLSLAQGKELRALTPWIVLAACSLAPSKFGGTLQDTNFRSPAQNFANNFNVKVTACKRALTFKEVGEGIAFATVESAMILVPTNHQVTIDQFTGADLWQEFNKQSPEDDITERISFL